MAKSTSPVSQKHNVDWKSNSLVPGKEFAPSIGMTWASLQVALCRKTYPILNDNRVYIGRRVFFPESLRSEFLNSRLSINLNSQAASA